MVENVIAIASDHAGFEMKDEVGRLLTDLGYEVVDLGTSGPESVDYPDVADALAAAMLDRQALRGILVCGTGIGISIAANRHRHIRAARCCNTTDARLARQHNDANVLVLGSRTSRCGSVRDCVLAFLNTEFESGRHQRRVDKMS